MPTRRSVLKMAAGGVSLAALGSAYLALQEEAVEDVEEKDPLADVAPWVKPTDRWGAGHLNDFLVKLPPAAMLALQRSAGMLEEDEATVELLEGTSEDAAANVMKYAQWVSRSIWTYKFYDPKKLDYHATVEWVGRKLKLDDSLLENAPTFLLEQEIQRKLFSAMWDKLDPQKRAQVLKDIDPQDKIKDKASIIMMGGSAAITALSGTVALTGFAFYTTMSTVIAATAAAFGITLPFAAYTTASTVVGALTGPLGWGIAAILGAASLGTANANKTARLIGAIHGMKVEALVAARHPVPIFQREAFAVAG